MELCTAVGSLAADANWSLASGDYFDIDSVSFFINKEAANAEESELNII